MKNNEMDLTGQRRGKLVGEAPVQKTRNGNIWRFRCDCGGSRDILAASFNKHLNCYMSCYACDQKALSRNFRQAIWTDEDLQNLENEIRGGYSEFEAPSPTYEAAYNPWD